MHGVHACQWERAPGKRGANSDPRRFSSRIIGRKQILSSQRVVETESPPLHPDSCASLPPPVFPASGNVPPSDARNPGR